MKVYTVTRILNDKNQKEFHNEVEKVFQSIEGAREYCEDVMKRSKEACTHAELDIQHHEESKGVESYEAHYAAWLGFTDYSSETLRIKEFDVE